MGERSAGITQIQYHPLSPHILFIASRASSAIAVYDLRNFFAGPFARLERESRGMQRIGMEVDWAGRWLVSGSSVSLSWEAFNKDGLGADEGL